MAFERYDSFASTPAYLPQAKGSGEQEPEAGMSNADKGDIAKGGIQAAGQTIATIANIMAQTAARNAANEQADLGRTSSLSMVKMQLSAAADRAEQARKWEAQQMLLAAMGGHAKNALAGYDLKHAANKAGSSFITQAFMR